MHRIFSLIEKSFKELQEILKEAKERAEMALQCKNKEPEVSQVYKKIAIDNISHAHMLHKVIEDKIERFAKSEQKEVPEVDYILDWEQAKFDHCLAQIEIILAALSTQK